MSDMTNAITPKSDQLNSDDLITGPITIKITDVKIKTGEQPVSIFYEGDKGKPYKCCKSMARIIVGAWGPDSKKYVGRSMTLYRDPTVRWAGMEVGGIRISHMSHLEDDMTMALTMTRSNRKPFTVKPLMASEATSTATARPAPPSVTPAAPPSADDGAVATYISDVDLMAIESIVEMKEIKGRFDTKLAASGIKSPDKIPASKVASIKAWVEASK